MANFPQPLPPTGPPQNSLPTPVDPILAFVSQLQLMAPTGTTGGLPAPAFDPTTFERIQSFKPVAPAPAPAPGPQPAPAPDPGAGGGLPIPDPAPTPDPGGGGGGSIDTAGLIDWLNANGLGGLANVISTPAPSAPITASDPGMAVSKVAPVPSPAKPGAAVTKPVADMKLPAQDKQPIAAPVVGKTPDYVKPAPATPTSSFKDTASPSPTGPAQIKKPTPIGIGGTPVSAGAGGLGKPALAKPQTPTGPDYLGAIGDLVGAGVGAVVPGAGLALNALGNLVEGGLGIGSMFDDKPGATGLIGGTLQDLQNNLTTVGGLTTLFDDKPGATGILGAPIEAMNTLTGLGSAFDDKPGETGLIGLISSLLGIGGNGQLADQQQDKIDAAVVNKPGASGGLLSSGGGLGAPAEAKTAGISTTDAVAQAQGIVDLLGSGGTINVTGTGTGRIGEQQRNQALAAARSIIGKATGTGPAPRNFTPGTGAKVAGGLSGGGKGGGGGGSSSGGGGLGLPPKKEPDKSGKKKG